MARRLSSTHVDTLILDTTAPKARLSSEHVDTLVLDTTAPKARLSSEHVDTLVLDTTAPKVRLTAEHVDTLLLIPPTPPETLTVFHDGCGEGFQSDADYNERWKLFGSIAQNWSVQSTVRLGITGTRSIMSSGGSVGAVNFVTTNVDLTTAHVEFWTRFTALATTSDVVSLRDNGALVHFKIVRTSLGSNSMLTAYDATGAAVSTAFNAGPIGNWTHVGIKLVTGHSGSVIVTFDDTVWISTSGDFLNGSNNFVRRVAFWANDQSNTRTYYDDIVIQGPAGSLLGSGVESLAIRPTAAGDSTQWTPSTGSNWDNVNDLDPNDDTDYNSSATVGQLDLFNVTDIPAGMDVYAVTAFGRLRKDIGGTGQAKLAIKTNSTVAYGSDADMLSSNLYGPYFKQWELNPITAAPWTEAEINALQIGVQVVA